MFNQLSLPIVEAPIELTFPYLESSCINSASHSLNLVVKLRKNRTSASRVVHLYQPRSTLVHPAFSLAMGATQVGTKQLSQSLSEAGLLEYINVSYLNELPTGQFKRLACRHYNLSSRMIYLQIGSGVINLSSMQGIDGENDQDEETEELA